MFIDYERQFLWKQSHNWTNVIVTSREKVRATSFIVWLSKRSIIRETLNKPKAPPYTESY